MTDQPEPLKPEPIQPLDIVTAVDAITNAFRPIFQSVISAGLELRRRLVQAHQQHVDWVRSDEGQAHLRHERDLEFIRRRARIERAAGSRAITRMFDEAYADLGLTRQETSR